MAKASEELHLLPRRLRRSGASRPVLGDGDWRQDMERSHLRPERLHVRPCGRALDLESIKTCLLSLDADRERRPFLSRRLTHVVVRLPATRED